MCVGACACVHVHVCVCVCGVCVYVCVCACVYRESTSYKAVRPRVPDFKCLIHTFSLGAIKAR